jgi:hypothetical protein
MYHIEQLFVFVFQKKIDASSPGEASQLAKFLVSCVNLLDLITKFY